MFRIPNREDTETLSNAVLLGIAGALLLTRFIESMLYDVTPTDPWTFLEFGVLSMLVSALAAYVPARRGRPGRIRL